MSIKTNTDKSFEVTDKSSSATLNKILSRNNFVLSEEQLSDIKDMTLLQVVSYLNSQMSKIDIYGDPSKWGDSKLQHVINDILAIPSECKRMRQIMEFAESMEKKFPKSWAYPMQTGDAVADFLASELLPNLSPELREVVAKEIDNIRSGAYGVLTRSTIFHEQPLYTSTWPAALGFYQSGSRKFEQRIFGLGILTVDLCSLRGYQPYTDVRCCVDLLRDWQVDDSKDRKIVPVSTQAVSPKAQLEILDTLKSFKDRIGLSDNLMTFRPVFIAEELRREAWHRDQGLVELRRSSFMRDWVEADEDAALAKDLRKAADKITALK